MNLSHFKILVIFIGISVMFNRSSYIFHVRRCDYYSVIFQPILGEIDSVKITSLVYSLIIIINK